MSNCALATTSLVLFPFACWRIPVELLLRFGTFRASTNHAMEIRTDHSKRISGRRVPLTCFSLFCTLILPSCGSTSGNSVGPGTVLVTIQPASASVLLGQTQPFTANVTGAANTSVVWNVNGTIGGSVTLGTISSRGVYTAPATLPSPPSVTVSAVSQANAEASASAIVNLHDDIIRGECCPGTNASIHRFVLPSSGRVRYLGYQRNHRRERHAGNDC